MRFRSVFVAGHRGLVGSAIVRHLEQKPGLELLTKTRKELDLRDRQGVEQFLKAAQPEVVVIAAAKVGGIKANCQFPVELLSKNLEIQNILIAASFLAGGWQAKIPLREGIKSTYGWFLKNRKV
jgi:GDP-L-fucose synthase